MATQQQDLTTQTLDFIHAVQTPLVTIDNYVAGLQNFLPELIEGYLQSRAHKLITPNISEEQLPILKKALQDIAASTKKCARLLSDFSLTLKR